jgi:hypothetical protein
VDFDRLIRQGVAVALDQVEGAINNRAGPFVPSAAAPTHSKPWKLLRPQVIEDACLAVEDMRTAAKRCKPASDLRGRAR